ncbi:MAG: hypothetical protein NVSMB49_16150 [Ktedonobacteraceae bacterium]
MIQFCIGEHDGLDWRMTYIGLRPKYRKCIDLTADIRRDIEKKPVLVICADANGRLRAWTTG